MTFPFCLQQTLRRILFLLLLVRAVSDSSTNQKWSVYFCNTRPFLCSKFPYWPMWSRTLARWRWWLRAGFNWTNSGRGSPRASTSGALLHLREAITERSYKRSGPVDSASMSVLHVKSVMSQQLPGENRRPAHCHAEYEEAGTAGESQRQYRKGNRLYCHSNGCVHYMGDALGWYIMSRMMVSLAK